jgi:hypothetical protein
MSRARFYNPQFDLFLPTIVDLRFRDQKDTMERPFFSLSKSKRMKPIQYQNENDGVFVTVQPHQDYGMATIWDADILIWAASVLCDMKNQRRRICLSRPHRGVCRAGSHALARRLPFTEGSLVKILYLERTYSPTGGDCPAGLLRRRQRQSAPLLSIKRHQCDG